MSSKRKRRIIAYGLVTRYGPQTNCQRKRLIVGGSSVKNELTNQSEPAEC